MKISATVANPSDQSWTRKKFVFWFGAGSTIKILAFGNLEYALEACGEWIEANAPGLLAGDEVEAAYALALADGKSDEEAQEIATEDTTLLDCGRYLTSHEWGIVAEDPSRDQLAEIFA